MRLLRLGTLAELTRGDDADALSRWFGIYSASVAVYLFFFISGFLVTGSWLRQRSLRRFLAARALRIVPAYAACLIAATLLLGASVTTLPVADYFADPRTWRYVWWNLSFPEAMQFTLPGVFEDHRRPSVNGSLWTLPAEFRAYALIAIVGLLGILERLPRLLLAVALCVWLIVFEGFPMPLVKVGAAIPMLGYFALGAIAWVGRTALPLDGRVVVVLLLVVVGSRGTTLYPYSFAITLCYACLWFAYVPRGVLLRFNRFGDYSYGVYLWGFPMQQLIVSLLHTPTPTLITLLAWPLALGCAIVSWHLIEKPALRWRGHSRRAAPVASVALAG
jgi:peptidoglycan/LPS O-acetylase OafA/YrhL